MKIHLLAILSLFSSLTFAGYGEINSVGDKRAVYHMDVVKSTQTDSKVVEILSKSEKYYVLAKN